MKFILAIGTTLAIAAGAALAQCSSCQHMKMAGSASMSGQTGGLAGLALTNLAGDTVRLSEHIGMMPMVTLIAGTDAASGKAADAVQATISAREEQLMLVYVLASGPKAAKTFAQSHKLSGLVLVDPKRTALSAAMADTLPVALFINQSGSVVKADAKLSEASVNEGIKSMTSTEERLADPVCGITVTKDRAAASYVYQGKTYYFCSKACKDSFAKDPQKYQAR